MEAWSRELPETSDVRLFRGTSRTGLCTHFLDLIAVLRPLRALQRHGSRGTELRPFFEGKRGHLAPTGADREDSGDIGACHRVGAVRVRYVGAVLRSQCEHLSRHLFA